MNDSSSPTGFFPSARLSSIALVLFVVSALHLWMHVASLTDSSPDPWYFGSRLLIETAVAIVVIIITQRARTRWGAKPVLVSLLAAWGATVFVSFAVHRASQSRLIDHIMTFMTAGLHPGSSTVAGVSIGKILLAAGLVLVLRAQLTRIPAFKRFISPHRHSNVESDRLGPVICLLPASGVALFGPSLFDLYARQHVERSVIDSATGAVLRLAGPTFPTFLWTVISASLLSILLLAPLPFVWKVARLLVDRQQATDASFGSLRCGTSFLASVWVVSLAFWIRIATLLTVAPTRTDGGDPLFYHVTANLLSQGRGFPEPLNFIAFQRWIPSALHGPAYPIVLSISSRLGGTTYFDHKFLSILIGTAVVALTMRLAHHIVPAHLRTASTVLSGLLAALYPNLWLVDGVLFPEGLMALFTLGVVLCAYRWWESPSIRWSLGIGALIAASALTRGEGLLLSVILVVPLMLGARRIGFAQRLVHLAVAGAACLAILAPWAVRNARSFEVFVPLSTNGNELFVYANCPEAYEGKFLGFWLFQCQEDIRAESGEPPGDEAEKSIYWRTAGIEYAKDNAEDLPRVLAARIGRQWEFFRPWQNTEFAPIEGRNKDAARIGLFMYYAMIPAAAAGALLLRRHGLRLLPIFAVFASVTLTAAYAYGTTRFRVPAEPLLCLLAAIGAARAIGILRSRWKSSGEHVSFNILGRSQDKPSFVEGGDVVFRRAFNRDAITSWVSFGIVLAGIAVTLPALYRQVGSSMEEGFMLVFPELVMRGLVPNVDFLHLYGPGSLQALAGWFRIFDVSLGAERTFGLVQHMLFVSGLMVLVRPWGRTAATLVGLSSLLFVLTPIGLQALAWNGALGLGVWSIVLAIRASHRSGRSSWIASGVLAGLTLTFRPDLALALGFATLFLLWRRGRRAYGSYLAGGFLGLVPFWWHLSRAGLRAVVNGMFLDPVIRLRGGRELPRPPSMDRLDGALQVISEKFAPWWALPHLSAPQQLFLWFFLLPLVSLGLFLTALTMHSHRRERSTLLAASLFSIGLLPQAFQRPDSAHFLWVSAMIFPLIIIAILEILRRRAPLLHPRLLLSLAASTLAALVLLVLPFYTVRTYADLAVRSVIGKTDVREVRRHDRVFFLGDERPWQATLEVVADLDTMARPGQRLFVGPVDLRQTAYSDAFFYHLFPELTPATFYIEMDPGLANQDPRLATDVSSADWLILTRFWSGWIEPNASIDFGSDLPNQVVERSFCLVKSYQNDLVRLFQRCPVGDGIGPYDAPYRPEHDYAVEVLVPVPPRPDGTCTPTCRGRPSISGIEIGIDTSAVE